MPVNASEVGEFDALLRNEMLPEAAPDAWGVKVTVKGALCPAINVTGNVMPLTENPSPLQLPDNIVTAEELAVSVPARALLLPTATLPKSMVEVEAESEPGTALPLPVGPVFSAVVPPPQPISRLAATSTKTGEYRDI